MKLLYGKPVADKILDNLKAEISKETVKPGLAVILVGDDKASHIYVNLKEKKAQEIGMNFFRFDLLKNVTQGEIIERIEMLNNDRMVNGIIVQLPLPEGFDTEKIITSIDPKKDADGFHLENTKKFLFGKGDIWPVFPRAIVSLLESSKEDIVGKKAIVVANSQEFGSIMVAALNQKGLEAEYVISNDISSNLGKIEGADVVVSAVGSPGLLKGQMFKSGSIVIDGGIEKVGEQVFGDVDFGSTEGLSGFITPVPGGVGPLTIACLLENTYLAFRNQP
ncbi:MAG: Bifunctional protein FolD [Candidatus Moranbacteria bacterium GW2011_GWC2_37_8]|nr:MAG: Bifunctional protein FolD [Candidatus Moranbacteria bacterium GW2011_GWC2_37_8]KKQ63344.1 MAG: Bifunctional protein FolD [Parcubacteria group bacterium GW2011_GWC1_38_22]KKQ79285.1 MAG: Bifunctional protein FolD [Candidatus Moranbacteria bacterium GW2011_GWD2_38_7]